MSKKLERRLACIVNEIGPRLTGTANNVKVLEFVKNELKDLNVDFTVQPFPCVEWYYNWGELSIGTVELPFLVNPMSKSCDVTAKTVTVSNMSELQACDCAGKILIISGDLTDSEYFPLSFPFYQIEGQKEIVNLLMEKAPAGLIAVSPKDEKVIPIFNDADLIVPSVTISQSTGKIIFDKAIEKNMPITLKIDTISNVVQSENILAVLNPQVQKKILICVHTDTHFLSPGALDNGTGVACLLSLAETLQQIKNKRIELIFFNSEDYYSAGGEVVYLQDLQHPEDIELVINIDGMGFKGKKTGISLYGIDETKLAKIETIMQEIPGFDFADQWYQGDHMIFFQQNIPCIAFCALDALESTYEILHTPKDDLDVVDYVVVESNVEFITSLIKKM